MESLITFLIAGAVTLFFVRGYLKKLTASKHSPGPAANSALPKQPCPRCTKPIDQGSPFCPQCGAALAMWNVHRAEIAPNSSAAPATGRATPVINTMMCIGCGSCVHACPETGTLELAGGKAILAHPDRCTGHAKCAEVCPTQAISLSIGGVLQTLKVPNVGSNFETNVPGIFIVGELGGFGLIKTAINEGKLVVDHLRDRLAAEDSVAGAQDIYDVAIIGAGPAGLSASLTAKQYGLNYITLEQGEIAATIRQYPRQKFLMAEPLTMPLYGNLYVSDGSKEALLSVWETIIDNTGVEIRTNQRVERIQRDGEIFQLETPAARHRARFIVLAIGKRGSPRQLNVPGEELSCVSYRLIEAETYHDKDLLVVGGGDSAIEAALALSRSGTNRVTLVHRRSTFDRVRQRNQEFLAQAEASGAVRILRDAQVSEITAHATRVRVMDTEQTIPTDNVFILIGGNTPEDFLRKTGIEIVEKVVTADAYMAFTE